MLHAMFHKRAVGTDFSRSANPIPTSRGENYTLYITTPPSPRYLNLPTALHNCCVPWPRPSKSSSLHSLYMKKNLAINVTFFWPCHRKLFRKFNAHWNDTSLLESVQNLNFRLGFYCKLLHWLLIKKICILTFFIHPPKILKRDTKDAGLVPTKHILQNSNFQGNFSLLKINWIFLNIIFL